ncbi:MAG TPA: SpoIIE family protein phosphatase [Bacteroidales bacterium]|nr:SpoIIE family protein phosphatase [Bacteroidales bacterium]
MSILYFSYYIRAILISAGVLLAGIQEEHGLATEASPYRYLLYSVILIALVYLIVMSQTRNLVKTRRMLKEKEQILEQVEKQKSELEIREQNITDSLNYAQRIQEALLPSEDYFRKYFRESFIFFKPKDIVSGDFYWIGEKNGRIFIVAADCTGHGVPGALMSMIGLEIIEKTINEDNIDVPASILAVLNKGLEKTFSREKNIGTIIRDGMDIGLCVIDRNKKKIEYAGAFFPLYLVRNDSLIEIKGDKLIIGMNPSGKAYENHEIDLMEDDILYLFSDGYIDQFGGSENKKFMYRRFRYLLTTIHSFPVNDQKSVLDENIRTWMGGTPQIDDMMVIGFRPFSGSD